MYLKEPSCSFTVGVARAGKANDLRVRQQFTIVKFKDLCYIVQNNVNHAIIRAENYQERFTRGVTRYKRFLHWDEKRKVVFMVNGLK